MTEADCIKIAQQYLLSRDIGYLPSGKVGRKEGDRWEIIFPVPESIDPNVAVVDPPDVRVWVNLSKGIGELIHQM